MNEKTINYITKYVTKVDEHNKTYQGVILTSAGIGGQYINRFDSQRNKFNGSETKEYYLTRTGEKLALPIYWRNKIYTEEQREQLWINKLDKEERWVCGEKISIKNGQEEYEKVLEYYRKINTRLGYGDGTKDYNQKIS